MKDPNVIIKNFSEKNIYYNFTNEFLPEKISFFVPLKGFPSPAWEGGIPEYLSPVKIPAKDFFGRERIIPGFGIDIGAVQISGNF